jgi:hypothetical protein
VPDFTTKLELISKRGTPVGAEELIERIEAQLGGDPLIVVTSRRMGALMTKTDQPTTTRPPGTRRGLMWALAAFVAILAIGGLYLAFSGEEDQVVDQGPLPTTTTPSEPATTVAGPAAMSDVETLEAGVTALTAGDGETATDLFNLVSSDDPVTDEEVAAQAEYLGASGATLTLDCNEPAASGVAFQCLVKHENALSDAIGYVDPGESFVMLVRDGEIVEFPLLHEHSWIRNAFVTFLSLERSGEGQEECTTDGGPLSTACGAIQVENAGAWGDWYRQSFEAFAESSGLSDAYEQARCGAVLTTDCATLMSENVDAWASWEEHND